MSTTKYLWRSLSYYCRDYGGLFVAAMLINAVLAAALYTGSALTQTLTALVGERLGAITHIIYAPQPLAAHLASRLLPNERNNENAIAALLTTSGFTTTNDAAIKLEVYGVDGDFFTLSANPSRTLATSSIAPATAWLNAAAAQALRLNVGDYLVLRLLNPAATLPDFLTRAPERLRTVRVRVGKILTADDGGNFNWQTAQAVPRNIFVDREWLAHKFAAPATANLFCVATPVEKWTPRFTLSDYGLTTENYDAPLATEKLPLTLLKSESFFLSAALVAAVQRLEPRADVFFGLLVNQWQNGEKKSPYSFALGVEADFFSPAILSADLREDEVVLSEILAADLNAHVGDKLTVKFFSPRSAARTGVGGGVDELTQIFTVRALIPAANFSADRQIIPAIPGLTDEQKCSEWQTALPLDLSRIRAADQKYWEQYGTTPQAYLHYEVARKMWSASAVLATALTLPLRGAELQAFTEKLIAALPPRAPLIEVKNRGLMSAAQAVNFQQIFLGLSFFVIVAALLLLAILLKMYLEKRRAETAILQLAGWSRRRIYIVWFAEFYTAIIFGGALGVLLGAPIAEWGLTRLQKMWDAPHLRFTVDAATTLTALLSGFLLSGAIIALTLRQFFRAPLSENFAENTASAYFSAKKLFLLALILIGGGLIMRVIAAQSPHAPAYFFASGVSLLSGLLLALRVGLTR